MKKRIIGYIDWLKNRNWSKLYKWCKWYHVAGFVYLTNMILNIIKENYSAATAYFIIIMFCYITYLKDKTIDSAHKLIKDQGKLIDSMLGLVKEIDEYNNRVKNN